MTYEQIEKSFFEHFERYGVSMDEDEDTFKFESPEPSVILSFLKQSFIKYLEKELEQEKEELEVINDIDNDFVRGIRYQMQIRISILQAQIKELEVN